MTGMDQKTWQSDFIAQQYAISLSKTCERHLEITSASNVLPIPGAIWLSPLCINGALAHTAVFQHIEEVGKWLDELFVKIQAIFFGKVFHELSER